MNRLKIVPTMAALAAGTVMLFGVVRTARAVLHPEDSIRGFGISHHTYGSQPLEIVGIYQDRLALEAHNGGVRSRGPIGRIGEIYALVVMAGDSLETRSIATRKLASPMAGTAFWGVRDRTATGEGQHLAYGLEYSIDASWRTVTLAGRSFDLSRGNHFVVHLGPQAQPRVTQIAGTFRNDPATARGDEAVTRRFVAALAPGDPARARLLADLAPTRPCPPDRQRHHKRKTARAAPPESAPQPSYPST
ncbi:MAG TPA: hypothetical protein VFH27_03180 [Longimicrobiaceae bacterium]|nr:hypothetical protein [Longimicrobiaceae bacterium]